MPAVDEIEVIERSDSLFSIAKISQYMFRQAVVTQEIRSGTYSNYGEVSNAQWGNMGYCICFLYLGHR